MHACLVLALYIVGRCVTERRGPGAWATFGGLVLAAGIGLLIGAVQLLPFAEFLCSSATLADGGRSQGTAALLYHPDWIYHSMTSVTLMFPRFFGSPATQDYHWPFPLPQNYNEQTVYFGLVPLGLAVAATLSRARRRQIRWLATLALLCLGVAFRVPGLEAINHLPLLAISLNKRLRIPFALLGAITAGPGLDTVLGTEERIPRRAAAFVYGAGSLLAAGILLAPVIAPGSWRATTQPVRQPENILLPLLVALGALLALRLPPRPGRWALLTLVAIELLVTAREYNPTIPRASVFPQTPLIEQLVQEHEPYRLLSEEAFPPNYGIVYGIAHVGGYDLPVDQRWSNLYRSLGGEGADYRQVWNADWPIVDWLNVQYIVTPRELPEPRFTAVYATDTARVYRNNHALPRATVAREIRFIPERDQALKAVIDPANDLQGIVILQQPLSQEQEAELDANAGQSTTSSVTFDHYGTDEVRLRVATTAPGVLTLSDRNTPGWRATIDGIETQVLTANYAFRAIWVPAGEHEVVFRYQPASFIWGMRLSLVGVLVAVSLSIMHQRRDRADRRTSLPVSL